MRTVLEHDWSGLPRVERALESLPDPPDPVSVSVAARGLVAAAVVDLDPVGAPGRTSTADPGEKGEDAGAGIRPRHVTPLDVVRWHVLEDEPWASMEARLREEGRPLSRGTLIRRQQEFLPALEHWASGGAKETPVPGDGEVPAPDPESPTLDRPSRSSPRRHLSWALSAVVIVVVLVAGATLLLPGASERPGDRSVAEAPEASAPEAGAASWRDENRRDGYVFALNQRVSALAGPGEYRRLPEPYPPLTLPDLDPFGSCALPIERVPGQPKILLGHNDVDREEVLLTLYDPLADRIVWTTAFDPPCDERRTHAGVGPEVCDETYQAPAMWYAGREGDLGSHAVVAAIQNYSPCFVLFVDLETGQVDGYYVHPGYLEAGFVVDVDQDGRMEVVLGGQDNAMGRAAVVALRPGPGRRAASSVAWNTSGEEGALARVLMPRAEALVRARGVSRLMIIRDLGSWFDYPRRVLPVGVGLPGESFFHVRLGPDLVPVDGRLDLWDEDTVHLREAGIAPAVVATWADDVIYVEGAEP